MGEDNQQSFKALADMREFGVAFARMIANLAVDPHGYFEKKYTARIELAETDSEIRGVLIQLVQWATSASVSDEERASLDKQLSRSGMPSIAELRLKYLP